MSPFHSYETVLTDFRDCMGLFFVTVDEPVRKFVKATLTKQSLIWPEALRQLIPSLPWVQP